MNYLANLFGAVLLATIMPAFASSEFKPVQSFVAGSLDMREVKKTMRVYAVYEGEDEIATAMRQRISELGYPLADSQETADIVFKVNRVYSGKASDRPKSGIYDGLSNREGISFTRLLATLALGAAFEPRAIPGVTSRPGLDVVNFWTTTMSDNGVFREIEHTFKLTKKPQDAIVSRIELTVNGVTQTADVVSESYAKDVPEIMIAGENLRQAVWYLE